MLSHTVNEGIAIGVDANYKNLHWGRTEHTVVLSVIQWFNRGGNRGNDKTMCNESPY